MTKEGEVSNKPKHKGFTFGKFILILFLLLVVVVAGIIFRVPQRLGIIKTPTELLLSETPDRDAMKTIENELTNAGVNLTGITVGVFPYKDREGNLAVFILDTKEGFKPSIETADSIINYYFTFPAKNSKLKELNIKRVAIDYKSKRGKSLISVTAPIEDINDFVNGKITNEVFMKKTKGHTNFTELINEWKEMFK